MRPTIPVLCSLAASTGALHAELIVYENTNPDFGRMAMFDPNGGDTIFGQALDITRGAFNQPAIGQTPAGSLLFMHTRGYIGDFTWMGMGTLTTTARSSQGVPIPDPWADQPTNYFGPQDFSVGDSIDESANFVDGWRAIHGVNDLTGASGIFTVAEVFSVGVRFELQNETHYGFARFARDYEVRDGELRIDLVPLVWGYETTPGLAASVTPAPATAAIVGAVFAGCLRRRRA